MAISVERDGGKVQTFVDATAFRISQAENLCLYKGPVAEDTLVAVIGRNEWAAVYEGKATPAKPPKGGR